MLIRFFQKLIFKTFYEGRANIQSRGKEIEDVVSCPSRPNAPVGMSTGDRGDAQKIRFGSENGRSSEAVM